MNKWITRFAVIYLLAYAILMTITSVVPTPVILGEIDDYSLPVASIMNEGDFSISAKDYEYYRKLFPEWADYVIDDHVLTGMTGENGGELTYYFPTYSIFCVPMTFIFHAFGYSAIRAFPMTNLLVLILALVIMFGCLDVSTAKRAFLVVALSLTPVCFYICWCTAETLLYSLMIVGLTCWYNRWYRRAALAISIAGTMNPVIMGVGIVMIAEYLYLFFREKLRTGKLLDNIGQDIAQIIGYGACYIVGLIPFIYNFYFTGRFNLISGTGIASTETLTDVFGRFRAYLLDLNLGILPYYPILMILALMLLILAILKRTWQYIEWIFTFLLLVVLYSIMPHINSGMYGIARYNLWASPVLLFAVFVLIDHSVIRNTRLMRVGDIAGILSAVITAAVVFGYGLNGSKGKTYLEMMPIAAYVLDHAPGMYNPLYSTFASRTLHIDGCYNYVTPIVYYDENNYARKILTSDKDMTDLLEKCGSFNPEDNMWFQQQVAQLTTRDSYISIPPKHEIAFWALYREMGTSIVFGSDQSNADPYILKGASYPEATARWTEGEEFVMRLKLNTDSQRIHCHIGLESVFAEKGSQQVTIFVNGEEVYCEEMNSLHPLDFDFVNPPDHYVEIKTLLPNAVSPYELGLSQDHRKLSLMLAEMVLTDAAQPDLRPEKATSVDAAQEDTAQSEAAMADVD